MTSTLADCTIRVNADGTMTAVTTDSHGQEHDGAMIGVCGCGRLVRLTARWQSTCVGCGQPIPTGAVAPYSTDDCEEGRHNEWANPEPHGCGRWNPPTETVIFVTGGRTLEDAIVEGLEALAVRIGEQQTADSEHVAAAIEDVDDVDVWDMLARSGWQLVDLHVNVETWWRDGATVRRERNSR